MKITEIVNQILACQHLVEFEYDGYYGNAEAFHNADGYHITMYYEGNSDINEILVLTPQELMHTPFFNGKSLVEIADRIENVDIV